MAHRFAEARGYLEQAKVRGATPADTCRLSLSIDQACGTALDAVLEARRRMAAESRRLEDLVPLGALLADLREFDEADRIYKRALREYQDVSPFAVAWVCFQLGVLWGELVPEPQSGRAAQWYRKAIEYLPCYVKARVHLAEIYSSCGRAADAQALLTPAVASGDPEVCWRLADVMNAMGRFADAEGQMEAARSGFDVLLGKHLLAFADHGAEFYSGAGNDAARALELASANVANRPTLASFRASVCDRDGRWRTARRVRLSRCSQAAVGRDQRISAIAVGGVSLRWSRDMRIGRRTFLVDTGLAATALLSWSPTTLSKASPRPNPLPSQLSENGTDMNCIVFKIDGWHCRDDISIDGSTTAPTDFCSNDLVDERVLISINQSWRAAWR